MESKGTLSTILETKILEDNTTVLQIERSTREQDPLHAPRATLVSYYAIQPVQDLENEHRFDEDDLRLLTALAGQVAPTVRNARLLAITQENAERDRQLYEITSNIRRANSIPEILEMTTRELSQVLNLKKAKIELSVDPSRLKNRDNGSEEGVK